MATLHDVDDPVTLANPIIDEKPDLESASSSSNIRAIEEDYIIPTEEEQSVLRKVSGRLPLVAYLLCFVEFAERASYYGAKGPFNNYMEFPLPEGGDGTGAISPSNPDDNAGALNMGLQFSSAMVLLFSFLAYLVPIFGGWVADAKIGRYRTILIGVLIGGVAHVIMIGGAAPALLTAGKGVAPFIISIFLLAIGAGIFKPNIAPTLIDQYHHQKQYVKTLKSGEKVIVDPEVTIQRILLIFYCFINIGAFLNLATTYAEKYRGYWIAFLIPGIVYFLLPILLLFLNKRLIKKPPLGSELTQFFKIIGTAIKQNNGKFWKKNFFDAARPSTLAGKGITVSWTDKNVHDAYRTLVACQIFLYFPIWTLNDGGVGAVQTNQGAAMNTNGVPNDLLGSFNSLTIIVCTPLLSHVLYPLLNRYKIRFGRISRITFGFLLATLSGVIGAIVQYYVYQTSPCGYQASSCDGVSPISIWWQLPNVMLGAISELFCNVTAYELAYARAPPNMKSVVMSMFLFNTALSSALAEILIPAIVDPYLVWAWAAPAIALFVQTAIFWWRHRDVNEDEYMTFEEPIIPAVQGPEVVESGKHDTPAVVDSEKKEIEV